LHIQEQDLLASNQEAIFWKAKDVRQLLISRSQLNNLQHATVFSSPNSNHCIACPLSDITCSTNKQGILSRLAYGLVFPATARYSFDLEGMDYSAIINDDNMLTINSANLDEFVRDAEGGPDPML